MTRRTVGAVARMLAAGVLVTACAAGLLPGAAATAPAGADEPATSTAPAGELATFYGFKPMEILKLEWGLGMPEIADVNGDGLNDLVYLSAQKSRIELLLQKKDFVAGAVTVVPEEDNINDRLGKEQAWRFKRVSVPLEVGAANLVVADLNKDSRLDLAFTSKEGLHVVLQEARPASAPAASAPAGPVEPLWQGPRTIDLQGVMPSALRAGDLNGDGRTDLAALAGDAVYGIFQKDDGALSGLTKYTTGAGNARQLDLSDLDGDGRTDVVVVTNDPQFPLLVRFQDAAGRLGPEMRLALPAPASVKFARLGPVRRHYLLTVAAQSGRVGLYALTAGARKEQYPVYFFPLPGTENADQRDVVAADVTGDGLLDAVVSDPGKAEFQLFRAQPHAQPALPESYPGLREMRKLAAADLDGDGKADVVALSIKEKLIGVSRLEKGRLTFPQTLPIAGEPVAMDLADADGDGTVDLLYISKDKKDGQDRFTLRTLRSVGRDSPDATTAPASAPVSAPAETLTLELAEVKDAPLDLRAADIDHDGRMDVMILRPYGPMVLVRQPEAGRFEEVVRRDIQAGLVDGIFPSALSIAPLAPGGKPAILVAQKNFARSLYFDAAKGWTVIDQYSPGDTAGNLSAVAAVAAAPGEALSIVTYDAQRGKLAILQAPPDGPYRLEREVEIGALTVRKLLAGNFGGDAPVAVLAGGVQKLVLTPVAGKTAVLRKLADYQVELPNARYGALTAGDLNADGVPEIVLAEQGLNHVDALAFTAEGKLVLASRFKVHEEPRAVERQGMYGRERPVGEPHAVEVADVTGDGKADLLLMVHDRLILYPQD